MGLSLFGKRCAAGGLLSLQLLLFSGCGGASPSIDAYSAEASDFVWETASPQQAQWDEKLIGGVLSDIRKESILAMVLVQDGKIAAEYYADGKPDRLYDLHSVTKSFTSALVGIAIDKGLFQGADQPIEELLPAAYKTGDADKASVTVGHLLSMTSGIDWPEWTEEWHYYVEPMLVAKDWTRFVMERPMAWEPGKSFNYNTGGWQVLSSAIAAQSGQSELAFAEEHLFKPLGIARAKWAYSPEGSHAGGFGLHLTARDTAKLGYLYLNKGRWAGKQIVSEAWVDESTRLQTMGDPHIGDYGYGWWLQSYRGFNAYFALGYAGQYMFVVPDLELVAVFTADDPQNSGAPVRYLERIVEAAAQ